MNHIFLTPRLKPFDWRNSLVISVLRDSIQMWPWYAQHQKQSKSKVTYQLVRFAFFLEFVRFIYLFSFFNVLFPTKPTIKVGVSEKKMLGWCYPKATMNTFFLFSSLGKNVFRFTFPIKRVLIWVIVWQNVPEISKSNIHQSFATFMIKNIYIYIFITKTKLEIKIWY